MGVISRFWRAVTTGYKLFLDNTEILKVTYAANETEIRGGAVAGDDLEFHANSNQDRARIKLYGDSNIELACSDTAAYKFNFGTTERIRLFGSNSGGQIFLMECTTPTAMTNYGCLYTKADNKLYFQDGAGAEHEVDFV